MVTIRDKKTGILGYGLTREDAIKSLEFNVARFNFNDEYKKRHEEMHPWLPLKSILHINGVGALKCENGIITNLKTGNSIKVDDRPYSQYLYLYPLLEGISFEDFTVTVSKEMDKFVEDNISTNIGKLCEFPDIKPGTIRGVLELHSGDEYNVIVSDENTVIVFDSQNSSVECDIIGDVECTVAYLLAYCGFHKWY